MILRSVSVRFFFFYCEHERIEQERPEKCTVFSFQSLQAITNTFNLPSCTVQHMVRTSLLSAFFVNAKKNCHIFIFKKLQDVFQTALTRTQNLAIVCQDFGHGSKLKVILVKVLGGIYLQSLTAAQSHTKY